MIPKIKRRPVPSWLKNLNNLDVLPIRDLLANSLYYPSCGRDGDPVRYLGGFIHSFVFVDYSIEHDEVLNSLQDAHHRFKGYKVVYSRDVKEKELIPNGCSLTPSMVFTLFCRDGRMKELQYNDWQPIIPDYRDGNPLKYKERIKEPFAVWAIHQRDEKYGEEHGPERFSLLYICNDSAATFQALYHGNKCVPEVVAIIHPGTGYGHNWTNFRNPSQIFARSVLNNPYGKPKYFLCDGARENSRDSSYWQEYNQLIHYWKVCDGELGLWKRNS